MQKMSTVFTSDPTRKRVDIVLYFSKLNAFLRVASELYAACPLYFHLAVHCLIVCPPSYITSHWKYSNQTLFYKT